MAEHALRPTKKVLKSAGLLPQSLPEHRVATGDRVPPQPEPVSQVFGPPTVEGGKTVVPLWKVQYTVGLGGKVARQVAVVEVSDRRVRVQYVRGQSALRVISLLLVTWNVCWLWWTVREWRAIRK